MAVTKIPAETARQLLRPTWLRAGITTAFAFFTIIWHGNAWFVDFWDGNDLTVARFVLAGFLGLAASMIWEYAKQEATPQVLQGALAVGAAAWLVAGVVIILVGSTTPVALAAGLAFLVLGVAELYAGLKLRAEFVPARDHVLLGAIGAATGIGLIAWWGLDIHGVIGIAGMGMILSAVLLLINAAGMTHEVRRSA